MCMGPEPGVPPPCALALFVPRCAGWGADLRVRWCWRLPALVDFWCPSGLSLPSPYLYRAYISTGRGWEQLPWVEAWQAGWTCIWASLAMALFPVLVTLPFRLGTSRETWGQRLQYVHVRVQSASSTAACERHVPLDVPGRGPGLHPCFTSSHTGKPLYFWGLANKLPVPQPHRCHAGSSCMRRPWSGRVRKPRGAGAGVGTGTGTAAAAATGGALSQRRGVSACPCVTLVHTVGE